MGRLFLCPNVCGLNCVGPIRSAIIATVPALMSKVIRGRFFFRVNGRGLTTLRSRTILLGRGISPLNGSEVRADFLCLVRFPAQFATAGIMGTPIFLSWGEGNRVFILLRGLVHVTLKAGGSGRRQLIPGPTGASPANDRNIRVFFATYHGRRPLFTCRFRRILTWVFGYC